MTANSWQQGAIPRPSSKPGHRIASVLNPGLGLGLILLLLPLSAPAQPLTLLEGFEVVTSRGYDVRIAEAHRQAAVLAENLARSHMRPQANAYVDYTWLNNRPEAIFGADSSPLSEDRFLRYGVTVRQTITDFGRTDAGVDSARAAALAQAGRVDQVRNGTALAFVQAYISLLKAEKTFVVAEQEVKSFEAQVADARALHDAGEVTRSDVLSTEVALSDSLQRRITAGDNRELAASRVNFLILKPLGQSLQVEDFPSPLPGNPKMEDLTTRGEAARPEFRTINEQIAKLEADLRLRVNDRYPVIFVSGGYFYEENPYRVYEDNWSAVLGITWDLYTGGARSAAAAQVVQELKAVKAERDRMRETIFLEIRDAHLNLNGAIQRLSVTEKALNQAEENLRLQKVRYQEGEASATDVTDAVTALVKVQNNHWGALYDRRGAEAQILYTIGADLQAAYEAAILPGQGADSESKNRESNHE